MTNYDNSIVGMVKFLTKEVIDLKREAAKTFLLNKRIYTVKEAALVSSLSEPFIYLNIKNGNLKSNRPSPKRILVKRYDLQKFLRSNNYYERSNFHF